MVFWRVPLRRNQSKTGQNKRLWRLIDGHGRAGYFLLKQVLKMSQLKTYPIRCPKCQHEQDLDLYESINVKTNPELKAQLMAAQLNTVTCEQCNASFRIDKPLLYHDPARKLLIYWIPTKDNEIEAGQKKFTECISQLNTLLPQGLDAPEVHLVFTRTELVERIFLLEAGLNERIIEYIKHMIYAKNNVKLDPVRKALLFNAEDSTPEMLCFVVQDVVTRQLESLLQYSRDAYTALCEVFDNDEQTAILLEMFPGPYISARACLLKEAAAEAESPEPSTQERGLPSSKPEPR